MSKPPQWGRKMPPVLLLLSWIFWLDGIYFSRSLEHWIWVPKWLYIFSGAAQSWANVNMEIDCMAALCIGIFIGFLCLYIFILLELAVLLVHIFGNAFHLYCFCSPNSWELLPLCGSADYNLFSFGGWNWSEIVNLWRKF